MTKILITGATGFIGIPLTKKLYQLGYDLKILIRETSDISPFEGLDNIEYTVGDITDMESLDKATENVDVIFHLAAYTGIWAKDKSIYNDINVKGTENIAKLALKKNIRLLYVSSFTALGPTPEEPVDETYEKTDEFYLEYERTKYEGKKVVQEYFKKGLNGNIFYPGIVYGPGDFNIFGEMLYDIVRGKFMGCPGDGESIACFSYVHDVVDAMINTLEREDINREDFILGGENILFIDYLNMIANIADCKEPRHFPVSMAKFYARLCEFKSKITGKKPYITKDTLNSFELNRSYSSEKAKRMIDYRITPLEEGLQKTIKWYQDYLKSEQK
ncbi:MAG: NAD-dependent epimerase/dehydratase family protein [Candidatus Lokiarchaeota archaeon]|nr:NAD-dependent epimerase/dehydratase family protein [Candidatus Lokiarchaeota archaeon]MBD3339520.1 NAD-dependent epimerase/dehydratase family protein [Candidatus Lokiarchaeota archaeon]